MKKVLVTGGTAFVSRYIAEYYVGKGYDVSVLNRNTKKQSDGVRLIEADRYHLGDRLRDLHFDVVIDTGYTAKEVELLLDALGSYENYVFISSSAVYPDNLPQPFAEETPLAENTYWRKIWHRQDRSRSSAAKERSGCIYYKAAVFIRADE